MYRPDQEPLSPEELVFQTRLSDGVTIEDRHGVGRFNARITSECGIFFDNGRGPFFTLSINFLPCLRNSFTYMRTLDKYSVMPKENLNKGPKEILEHPELIHPLAKRLALSASILECVPNKLPDSYPKLKGALPLALALDLASFIQDPNFQIEKLESVYGLGPATYKNEHDNLANIITHEHFIGQRLEEILREFVEKKVYYE